jgi:hypothetical protein
METKTEVKDESTYVFDKSFSCPVCDSDFKSKQVKTGKARFLGTDDDLRPRYSGIDTVKYDVCMCPHCGYASTVREFNNVTTKQRKLLKETIGDKFVEDEDSSPFYSYDTAIRRYKMALLTAMTKPARGSEQAYLCLKLSWLYSGAIEDGQEKGMGHELLRSYEELREQYVNRAYSGFTDALLKEYPPICGMDEQTLNFLMAVLAHRCSDDENAQKFAYMVIGSRNATNKLKEKARMLNEQIRGEL